MTMAERLRRLMIEVTPFKLGHSVTIAPSCEYAADWPGTYTIVGMTWDYQRGDGHQVNFALASEDDIVHRHGSNDCWCAADLIPANRTTA